MMIHYNKKACNKKVTGLLNIIVYKKKKCSKIILTKNKKSSTIYTNINSWKEKNMITNLHIKNIGIIGDLEINLNKGMNVLTGETGAGKSLIIDSLGIICGERFSKEIIWKGEHYSYLEMCIYSPEDSNSVDGNIIITREVYSNGINMCKINGRLVTVSELRNFMSNYIEIHGQNDNQKLLDTQTHINK